MPKARAHSGSRSASGGLRAREVPLLVLQGVGAVNVRSGNFVYFDNAEREIRPEYIMASGARGEMPRTLAEAAEREKDIRYSSRTRLNTDMIRRRHRLQMSVHNLLAKLPKSLEHDPDVERLRAENNKAAISIVHLIYRRKHYESQSKDYEFSRASVTEHWQAGRFDVRRTLRHVAWKERTRPTAGVAVFDLTRDATD